MDDRLDRAWRAGLPPFDGRQLVVDELTLPALTMLVRAAWAEVRSLEPDAEYIVLEDWHEHDGFGQAGRKMTAAQIDEQLASDLKLLQWSPTDFRVYRLIYPESCSFCLRYHHDWEPPPPRNFETLERLWSRLRGRSEPQPSPHPACPACGYNRESLEAQPCPECGAPADADLDARFTLAAPDRVLDAVARHIAPLKLRQRTCIARDYFKDLCSA